jgi:hypothetical protein
MEKEFIPYTLALALKKLGFDEPFNPFDTFYYRNGYLCEANKNAVESFNNFNDEVVLAPLYQQAFRWFREKYGLFIGIVHYENGYSINDLRRFDTYEEAENACINKLIEIANEQSR